MLRVESYEFESGMSNDPARDTESSNAYSCFRNEGREGIKKIFNKRMKPRKWEWVRKVEKQKRDNEWMNERRRMTDRDNER